MSVMEIERRLLDALGERSQQAANRLINMRPRPSIVGGEGGYQPGQTAEEIAFQTIETTAELRTIAACVALVRDTCRQLVQPEGESGAAPESRRKGPYA